MEASYVVGAASKLQQSRYFVCVCVCVCLCVCVCVCVSSVTVDALKWKHVIAIFCNVWILCW